MARKGRRKFQAIEVKVDGQTVSVPTWAETDESGKVTFEAALRATGEEWRNADVNALLDTVIKAVTARLSLTWRLMLKVTVDCGAARGGTGLRMGLGCYRVAEAADGAKFSERVPEPWTADEPWDGTWRPEYHFAGGRITDDFPRTGEQKWGGEDTMIALVPATLANVEAARSLLRRLRALSLEVYALFDPGHAETTLRGIAARTLTLALPPGEPEAAPAGRSR